MIALGTFDLDLGVQGQGRLKVGISQGLSRRIKKVSTFCLRSLSS